MRKSMICLALFGWYVLAYPACSAPLEKLAAPSGFALSGKTITWEEVESVVGYVAEFQNRETETAEPRFTLFDDLEAGDYTIEVMAIGDYESYADSEWTSFSFTLEEPPAQDYDPLGLLYTLLPDGSGYEVGSGKADLTGTVTIPDYFKWLPVKRIADYGFTLNTWQKDPLVDLRCNKITTKLILPSALEEIGTEGLSCLTRVEEFVLPESVKVIGDGAFYGCTHLKRINLPDGIKEIPSRCFMDCDLDEIEIPGSVEKIGNAAFKGSREDTSGYSYLGYPEISKGMQSLKKVVIPDSVKIIEREAFRGCSNLKEISLSGNLTWLGDMSFYGTAWLDACAEGPVMLRDIFYGYIGQPVSVAIPQTAKKIAGGAFMIVRENVTAANKTLEEVTIPDGVKLIGENIFRACRNLTSVRLPQDLTEIPEGCFSNCILLEEIELPKSVKTIGDRAFCDCNALKEMNLPDGLEEIGLCAFSNCAFTEIVIPHSLKIMGERPFPATVQAIYYEGTAAEWSALKAQNNEFSESGTQLKNSFGEAVIYYFAEDLPKIAGNYWRYVDGKPTVWEG